MSPISALTYDNEQHIFDQIDRQFQLSQETLVELSKAFLREFSAGLGEYNHPMAMMYVTWISVFTTSDTFKPYVCDRRSRWHRNWVSFFDLHNKSETNIELRTFLALDLGGTNM